MAEEVGQAGAGGVLRMRACPGCDYSLESLAAEGVCPECGRGYDQRYVVLSGVGQGARDQGLAGGTGWGMVSQVAVVGFLFLVVARGRVGWDDPIVWMMGGVALVGLGPQLYVRLFSAREPRMQLWVSEEGVGQVASTPEARWAEAMSRVGWLLFGPAYVVAVCFRHGRWVPGVGLAVVMTVVAALAWRWQGGWGGGAAGDVPLLHPWRDVEAWEVKEVGEGRARVRCKVMRRWGRVPVSRVWMVDIEVACWAEEAAALREKMRAWRGRHGRG